MFIRFDEDTDFYWGTGAVSFKNNEYTPLLPVGCIFLTEGGGDTLTLGKLGTDGSVEKVFSFEASQKDRENIFYNVVDQQHSPYTSFRSWWNQLEDKEKIYNIGSYKVLFEDRDLLTLSLRHYCEEILELVLDRMVALRYRDGNTLSYLSETYPYYLDSINGVTDPFYLMIAEASDHLA